MPSDPPRIRNIPQNLHRVRTVQSGDGGKNSRSRTGSVEDQMKTEDFVATRINYD